MKYVIMPILEFIWEFIITPVWLLIMFMIVEIIMITAGVFIFLWTFKNPYDTMEFCVYRGKSIRMLCPFRIHEEKSKDGDESGMKMKEAALYINKSKTC